MRLYDTGGTVAACLASPVLGFFFLATGPPSHTKYKQTLKMEPVNTHTHSVGERSQAVRTEG